jgi:1,4-alpha-glucan branching enzyme
MPRKNVRKQPPKKRVQFRLTAPQAKEVALVGTFNDWDPQARSLKLDKKGIWKTSMTLEAGAYEYRFLVDGQWQNDPRAETVPNPCGSQNSVRDVA